MSTFLWGVRWSEKGHESRIRLHLESVGNTVGRTCNRK